MPFLSNFSLCLTRVLVLNSFIFFCFVSTFVDVKNELPLFFNWNFFLPREKFPFFSFCFSLFFLSHTQNNKMCLSSFLPTDKFLPTYKKIKRRRKPTDEKIMFYLFIFPYFFSRLISVCAFFRTQISTWKHINIVRFNPRIFFKVKHTNFHSF